MKKCLFIGLLLAIMLPLEAVERVSLERLQQEGWESFQGRQVKITTPLYLCGIYYDSLILSPQRLYVPEEKAEGLADGDSTMYKQLVAANRENRICLTAKVNGYELRTGAVIRNLTARVKGARQLETGATPVFRKTRPQAKVPGLDKTDLRICSANIQNFFYHLGGYAQKKTTPGQFDLQRLKIATALRRMNADIYTLCELEKGTSAPEALVNEMNRLAHKPIYGFVNTGASDGDTISVGYIYRTDKVEPYGPPRFAYEDMSNIYACRFILQGWRFLGNYEIFYVSLNHLRSKRGDSDVSNRKRMANVDSVLHAIDQLMADDCYRDDDLILLGDYNSYTMESPIQAFIRAGYSDMLPAGDYSYVYDAEMGYLDRCFASPSMAEMITRVVPVHWNADTHYTYGFRSKYNYKNRMIPSESSDCIKKQLSRQGKRNLIYRYADHDPILVGLRFVRK